MSKDKGAEIVETMAKAAYRSHTGYELDVASKFIRNEWIEMQLTALNIVLKTVADEVLRLSDEWHKEWRAGHKANTYLEGKSDGADECANAILALISEGVSE